METLESVLNKEVDKLLELELKTLIKDVRKHPIYAYFGVTIIEEGEEKLYSLFRYNDEYDEPSIYEIEKLIDKPLLENRKKEIIKLLLKGEYYNKEESPQRQLTREEELSFIDKQIYLMNMKLVLCTNNILQKGIYLTEEVKIYEKIINGLTLLKACL